MPSEQLPQYLRTHRKRVGLSQEDVAWLMGCKSDSTISSHEQSWRKPCLEHVLAYEIIYGHPARELFAGFFESAQLLTRRRAAALIKRLEGNEGDAQTASKLAVLRMIVGSNDEEPKHRGHA